MTGMRALLILVLTLAAGCGSPPVTPPPAAACEARVDRGVLPEWARAGFTDAAPAIPHVIGAAGGIAAILFGDPLTSPPSADHTNKILWVSGPAPAAPAPSPSPRQTGTRWDLEISAQRMDGATPVGEPVLRTVEGGPGPSIVDLPEAGCWRLTLDWDYRTDTLDLEYIGPG
jgi:hypothetical protein